MEMLSALLAICEGNPLVAIGKMGQQGHPVIKWAVAGLILGLRPANERRRFFVTTSLIAWAQT